MMDFMITFDLCEGLDTEGRIKSEIQALSGRGYLSLAEGISLIRINITAHWSPADIFGAIDWACQNACCCEDRGLRRWRLAYEELG